MLKTIGLAAALVSVIAMAQAANAACNYPDDRDSAGRRCGGRAASVIPGGRLGGDGRYTDSYGRDRLYGRNNDPYDRGYGGNTGGGSLLNNGSDFGSGSLLNSGRNRLGY